MKRNSYLVGGALALGLLISAALTWPNAPSPMMPAAQAVIKGPSLQREELEGADVAKLLWLDAYKWRYSLPAPPQGRTIHGTFWIEDWHRGNARPKVYGLGAMSLTQLQGTLMLKMPRNAQENFVVASSGATMSDNERQS